MNKLTAICTEVVASCDRSDDLWEYYSFFHEKMWKDCPMNVILVNETKPLHVDKSCFDKQILVGNVPWSDMVIGALKQIDTKYVLMNFEDQWPKIKIDNKSVENLLDKMEEEDIGCVQIYKRLKRKDELVEIKFGEANRMTCSTSIWNRLFLMECLEKGEKPWRFETYGSYRERTAKMKVYMQSIPIFPFVNVLRKGIVRRETYRYAKLNGKTVVLQQKPQQSLLQELTEKVGALIYAVSPGGIIKIQKMFGKGY